MTTQVYVTFPKPGKENRKVGLIPVTTTSNGTCPDACPLKRNGCYAEGGPLGMLWRRVSDGTNKFVLNWGQFLDVVRRLQPGQLWRHNQAGDLPGQADSLDTIALAELVAANKQAQARGFTYTHKPLVTEEEREAIRNANSEGFTINLSGNNLAHADSLAEMDVGPVVTVLPVEVQGNVKMHTPAGRRVVVCPATYRDNVSCASCQLCQRANRQTIVGFPAHGASKRKASNVTNALAA